MAKEKKESGYKFFKLLSGLVVQILKDNGLKSKEGDIGWDLEKEMTRKQKRIVGMYKRYSRILKTIDQLNTVAKLLAVKPSVYFTNTVQIEYSKYLEYNLEIYYIRFTSIVDQAILLVSEFYDLGTDPKQTNLRTLTCNMHTKGKDATAILKKFDKLIQPIKRVRN
ncbi:Cthe_2314 family HEPN domain-containing protein [Phaeodactylibacter xiamenensis]|uniref:Cthe_2314 family HEPN domain-containing protein n=1 Tax=Phaeodactylibacter xiamenensis TaxID=1524460 RepID=UPI0024A95883|nr:Cthe_2314 family HEPN domain-containing protein [Phaeodactylibacter xiamenensis]